MDDALFISLYEKALPDTLSLGEKLTLLRACGYSGMEISVDETDTRLARVLDPQEYRRTLEIIRQHQVPVRTMCLSGQRRFPMGSRDPAVREKSFDILKKAIDFSAEAGIRIIQIPGYDVWYEPRGTDTGAYFQEGVERILPYAASAGVILGFETMEDAFMNTCRKALPYVQAAKSPYLQIYPDLGNIRNGTEDPISDLAAAQGHIAAVHLKDTLPGVFRNLEYGQGRVDFTACLELLLKQKVRLYNCEFWYDGKTEPAEYIRRNLDYMKKCFAQAGGVIGEDLFAGN